MEFKCPRKKCGGVVRDESPGVDFDILDEHSIAKNDFQCSRCGTSFSIFFRLDQVEDSEEGDVKLKKIELTDMAEEEEKD